MNEVPENIIKELHEYGFAGEVIGANQVSTGWFEVKGHADVIDSMLRLGWRKGRGAVRNGRKLALMYKFLDA